LAVIGDELDDEFSNDLEAVDEEFALAEHLNFMSAEI